jgi:hypothetical protein
MTLHFMSNRYLVFRFTHSGKTLQTLIRNLLGLGINCTLSFTILTLLVESAGLSIFFVLTILIVTYTGFGYLYQKFLVFHENSGDKS